MQANKEQGIWTRIKGRIKWVFKELKEDSVVVNPEKPVDCCNPPVREKDAVKKN